MLAKLKSQTGWPNLDTSFYHTLYVQLNYCKYHFSPNNSDNILDKVGTLELELEPEIWFRLIWNKADIPVINSDGYGFCHCKTKLVLSFIQIHSIIAQYSQIYVCVAWVSDRNPKLSIGHYSCVNLMRFHFMRIGWNFSNYNLKLFPKTANGFNGKVYLIFIDISNLLVEINGVFARCWFDFEIFMVLKNQCNFVFKHSIEFYFLEAGELFGDRFLLHLRKMTVWRHGWVDLGGF